MSPSPGNHVVCVHGVCRHYVGFEQCWGKAIGIPDGFDYVAVRWNPKDSQAPNAVCSAAFPAGWIEVDKERGRDDALEYVRRPFRLNPFREQAIAECQRVLTQVSQQYPDDRLHVIGHSLGSVIAYQALHRMSGTINAKSFITVGGVLNFVGIEGLLAHDVGRGPSGKLLRPVCQQWTNIMDRRDFCYQLSGESLFDAVEFSAQDEDHTGDVFGGEGQCPALPPIDGGFLCPKINQASVCAHLYYFDADSAGGDVIAAALKR